MPKQRRAAPRIAYINIMQYKHMSALHYSIYISHIVAGSM